MVRESFSLPAIMPPGLDALLRGLAGNPGVPPDVLLRLTAAGSGRPALARRRDLPADAAAALAPDRDVTVRLQLASNPGLPPEVQAVLAVDADPRVRGRLAEGADYFVTAGVHGRRVPGPLAREVYELLARDPEPRVRRALTVNRHLPDDVRAAMLDDADWRTAACAAAEWSPVPAGRIRELLSRLPGADDRRMLLGRLDGPLPAEAARAVLADIDSAPSGTYGLAGLLWRVAEVADLDADLTSRFLDNPEARPAVAANPTLPARHVAALACDPDNQVRAAVAARRGLDPALRESIPVDYSDRSTVIVGWLLADDLSGPDLRAFARSRHQVFRKTLAMRPDLPDEIVDILARDDSFAVRLFVCERQPNAPGWLLAQTAAEWTGFSRWDILAHKNFPADAATRLARSQQSRDRAVAAAHPGLAADLIEALLADDDTAVRHYAAVNPAIPPARLAELLTATDPDLAAWAAANRTLPRALMHQVLDKAGL